MPLYHVMLEEFNLKGFESITSEGNNNRPKSKKIGVFLLAFVSEWGGRTGTAGGLLFSIKSKTTAYFSSMN